MPTVDVTTFYLEMRTPPHLTVLPPRADLTVIQAKKPTVAYYRFLYDSVGSYNLWSRFLQELRAAGGKAAAFLPIMQSRLLQSSCAAKSAITRPMA